jgi:prepilin-type N-terminal cleavage/methylation domain-containing protein/prepilin-type processing-associated H-X9-DG protein
MRVGTGTKRFANNSLGFSLVELLVVISIIAVLAAIMFPMMIKAKQMAQISECLSNMKQVGGGLNLYLNEYDGHYPPAAQLGVPWRIQGKTIQELLTPYVHNGMVSQKVGNGYIYPKRSVFCCPSDTGILPKDNGYMNIISGKSVWIQTGSSYMYYSSNQPNYLRQDTKVLWTALSPEVWMSASSKKRIGAPQAAVKAPSRKAVLGDIWYWHLGDQVPPNDDVAFSNILFSDGHAARVSGVEYWDARDEQLAQYWHSYQETGE